MSRSHLQIVPGSPEHMKVISASKVAAILGVSRWESAYRLWHRMSGLIDPEPPKDKFMVGHAMELAATEMYREDHPGWRVSRQEVQFVTDAYGFPAVVTLDRRVSRGSHRRVLEIKALACSTPILTTAGWSTMGELRDGDEVFAPDGQPTKVLAAKPIMFGRLCYRVRFRDGQEIVTDADHLWEVDDRPNGDAGRIRLRTTYEMYTLGIRTHRKSKKQYRFRVPVANPIQLPHAELPIDPWLLGYWLGDGSADEPRICCGEGDLPYLLGRLDGLGLDYTVNRHCTPDGSPKAPMVYVKARAAFRILGLLKNKHIPTSYLLASEDQRRQLLAGLMDSDGTIGGHQAQIGMTRPELMQQVLQIIRSLGYRATYREGRASLHGRDVGPVYWVKFCSKWGEAPFDLPRKREVYEQHVQCGSRHNLRLNAITSIEPVPTVPVRCIRVAHESSLYLAGSGFLPTHNTTESIEDWGDPFTDEAPMDYLIQTIAQMGFSGYTDHPAHLMVLGPRIRDRHIYEIPFAQDIWEWILADCKTFWDSLAGSVPPPLDNSVATYECVRALHPDIDKCTHVKKGDQWICSGVEVPRQLILRLRDARYEVDRWETELRGAKTELLDLMKRDQHARVGNVIVANRQNGTRGSVALVVNKKPLPEQPEPEDRSEFYGPQEEWGDLITESKGGIGE